MEACFASMLIRGPTVGRDYLLSLLYKCHVLSRGCLLLVKLSMCSCSTAATLATAFQMLTSKLFLRSKAYSGQRLADVLFPCRKFESKPC